MSENNIEKSGGFLDKIRSLREKYLPYNEKTVKVLAISASVMFGWIIIWALIFKMCDKELLGMTYRNLSQLTMKERIMWDLIPFNYRGTEYWKMRQFIDTILNCFVFAPLEIFFCYIFKKKNLIRDAAICFGLSVAVELIQLATMLGNPATEDLFTNTVGCFIGFGLYQLLFKRISTKTTVIIATVINLVLGIATVYSLVTAVNSADIIYGIITRTL